MADQCCVKAKNCLPVTLPVDRFCVGHPPCAGSASVTTDDPLLAACVREIDRSAKESIIACTM